METVEGEVVVERTVGDDAPGAFRLSSEDAAADSTNTDKEYFRMSKRQCIREGLMPEPSGPFEGSAATAPVVSLDLPPAPMSEKARGKQPVREPQDALVGMDIAESEEEDEEDEEGEEDEAEYDDDEEGAQGDSVQFILKDPSDFLAELRKFGFKTVDKYANFRNMNINEVFKEMQKVPPELMPDARDSERKRKMKAKKYQEWARKVQQRMEDLKEGLESVIAEQQVMVTNIDILITEYYMVYQEYPPAEMLFPIVSEYDFLIAYLENKYGIKFDNDALKAFDEAINEASQKEDFIELRTLKLKIKRLQALIGQILEEEDSQDKRLRLRLYRETLESSIRKFEYAINDLKSKPLPPGTKSLAAYKELVGEDEGMDSVVEKLNLLDSLSNAQDSVTPFQINDNGIGIKNKHIDECNQKFFNWRTPGTNPDLVVQYAREWNELYKKYLEDQRRILQDQSNVKNELFNTVKIINSLQERLAENRSKVDDMTKQIVDLKEQHRKLCGEDGTKVAQEIESLAHEIENAIENAGGDDDEQALALPESRETKEARLRELRVAQKKCTELWGKHNDLVQQRYALKNQGKELDFEIELIKIDKKTYQNKLNNYVRKRKTVTEEERKRLAARDKENRQKLEDLAMLLYDATEPWAIEKAKNVQLDSARLRALRSSLDEARQKCPVWEASYKAYKQRSEVDAPALKEEAQNIAQNKLIGAQKEIEKLKPNLAKMFTVKAFEQLKNQIAASSDGVAESAGIGPSVEEVTKKSREYAQCKERLKTAKKDNDRRSKCYAAMQLVETYERQLAEHGRSGNDIHMTLAKNTAEKIRNICAELVGADGLLLQDEWNVLVQQKQDQDQVIAQLEAECADIRSQYQSVAGSLKDSLEANIEAARSTYEQSPAFSKVANKTGAMSDEDRQQVENLILEVQKASLIKSAALLKEKQMKVQLPSEKKEFNGNEVFQKRVKKQMMDAKTSKLARIIMSENILDELFDLVYNMKGAKYNVDPRTWFEPLRNSVKEAADDPDYLKAIEKLGKAAVARKRVVRKAVDDKSMKKRKMDAALMQEDDATEFETAVKKNSVKEIIECAKKGSGRALHFYRLVCTTLSEMYTVSAGVMGTTQDCSSLPSGDSLVVTWENIGFLRNKDGGERLIDTLNYILTQWTRLPVERRCGSMPSEGDLQAMLPFVANGADGSPAVIDEITSEIMVVTPTDAYINSSVFNTSPPVSSDQENLSEPLVPKKRTPVSFAQITRGRFISHVPVDDEFYVAHADRPARSNRQKYLLHLTRNEQLDFFMSRLGGDQVDKELRAEEAMRRSKKWPLNVANPFFDFSYDEFSMNDMDDAMYASLLKAQTQLVTFKIQQDSIDEDIAELDAEEAKIRRVKRAAPFPLKSNTKFTEETIEGGGSDAEELAYEDEAEILQNESVVKKLGDISVKMRLFKKNKRKFEQEHFINRGLGAFGPLVGTKNATIDGLQAHFAKDVDRVLTTIVPTRLTLPPEPSSSSQYDGLNDWGWTDDASISSRVAAVMNRFIDAYYDWVPKADPKNAEQMVDYLLWMIDLRDQGFPYVALLIPNVPFSVVVPRQMSPQRLVLGPGPENYESGAFTQNSRMTIQRDNMPQNLTYRLPGQPPQPLSDDEFYKNKIRQLKSDKMVVNHEAKETQVASTKLEQTFKNAIENIRRDKRGSSSLDVVPDESTMKKQRMLPSSSDSSNPALDALRASSKLRRAADMKGVLLQNGPLAKLATEGLDYVKLSWPEEGGVQGGFEGPLNKVPLGDFEKVVRALSTHQVHSGKYSVAIQYIGEGDGVERCVIVSRSNDDDEYDEFMNITESYEIPEDVKEWLERAKQEQEAELQDGLNEEYDDEGEEGDELVGMDIGIEADGVDPPEPLELEAVQQPAKAKDMDSEIASALAFELESSDFDPEEDDEDIERELVDGVLAEVQCLHKHCKLVESKHVPEFDLGAIRDPLELSLSVVSFDEIEL